MKYCKLTKFTLISILISIPVVLSSQTNVTGEVYGVWDKNNSPYLINSNITVPNGSSLVIEPGVEVQFMGHYKFSINGTLSAIGTSTEMIHFTVADTSGWSNRYTNTGGWGGLKFDRTQSSDTSKIEYCKFEYGKVMGDGWEEVKAGGAIFIDGFSKIRIQNTVFTKNWAQWYGGAIYCEGANPVFENLLIYSNQAERNGGGICIESHSSAQPDLINLTITENISQKGGGIYCDWGCSPNIINTIIWNNSAENGAQIFLNEVNADPNFINCIIEGGKTGFEGNGANLNFNGKVQNCMMNDPLFVNPEAFNFQLQKNSHGINTGSLHSLNRIPNYDIKGNNRVYGDSIDIGVYEYQELPMNRIPVLEDLPDLQTNVDTPIEFNLSFYDPDLEDVHEVVISSDVPGTEIVKMNDQYNSAKYKVIPPTEWRGTITITAKVADNENQTSILNTKTFHIKVSNTFEAGGDIIENTIWNSDTISVNSNIIIHDDVLLQIAAGTIVEFQGDYNIKVEGTILAIGNENDSIVFCPKDNLTNWSGVKLVNDSGDAMSDNDSTKFINCIFTGVNNYNEIGGVIYLRAFSKVLIKGCRITNNVCGYGAITCRSNANALIDGNFIGYNQANQNGGGIWCDECSPTIINNTIVNNGHINIPQLGGGIALENSDAYIANNVIANNMVRSGGGGISCYYSSSPKILNNTICYNSINTGEDWLPGYGGGIACDNNSKPQIVNCILWNNTNQNGYEQLYLSSGNGFPSVHYNIIQGGLDSISGLSSQELIELKEVSNNNLRLTPEFNNVNNLDFTLQSFSPCIDQGIADTSGLNLPQLDYLRQPRIVNKGIDIGAIEYQGIPANKKPVLKRNGEVSGLMNAPIQMYVIFEDLDVDDTHTISIASDNPDLQIKSINGDTTFSTYEIVTSENWIGTANITVTVTDNSGESNSTDSYTYPLTIKETACGDILGNTIWNNDTVKVTCDVTVEENATLTISPGTVIEFQDYNRINIYGKLLALGEIGDTILFTVKDTTNYWDYHGHSGWNGIRFFNNVTDTSIVQYAKLEYGKANDNGNNCGNNNGGAINIDTYSNVKISNCVFFRNYSKESGSAIYSVNSSPVISNCKFTHNHAKTSTIVVDNKANLIDNLVAHNYGKEWCAGITCSDSSVIIGNRVLNNQGTGMKCFGSPTILNTIICNNSGLGMSFDNCNSQNISNIIIYNNGAYGTGAIYTWSSYIDVYNSIISGSIDTSWGYPTFHNCLLDISGDYSKDLDCIYALPSFVAPSSGIGVEFDAIKADWSLLPTSYCINTGIESNIKNFDKDIAGSPRIFGDNIDIGPYEYQSKPQNRKPLLQGIDDKEVVNFSEMELAVDYWDPDITNIHSITVTSNSPHVEIAGLSGDTIGSTFNVVSIDDWEGTAQITIQVNDNSGSDNSTASETVNIIVSNDICGHISNNSTWLGDTVKISCPIIIDDEVCLKIMPGTHIEFSKDAYIEVVGILLAEGNKSDSIVFSTLNSEAGWKGINFKDGFYAYEHPSGIMNDNDTSKFSYCKFEYCSTRAFFIDGFDRLVISNSRFVNNQGQCIQTFEASPMIRHNVFEYNTCSNYESGTIWCERYSNPKIIGNIIRNNTGILGGGINCDYHSNPLIENNLIYNNDAEFGGGIYCTQSSPQIVNNTIVNNKAANGAGIYCRYSSPYLYNSIIWGNEATGDYNQIYNHGDARNISNCLIPDNGLYLTNDNYETGLIISSSPNFINEIEGDYNLAGNSICINTGSNEYVEMNSINQDILGNDRINDSMVDIGAYEFQGDPEEMAPIKIDLSNNYVYENRPIRTFVGLLTALDPNYRDIHSYSFADGEGTNDEGNSSFVIVGDTLFTNQEFDYESKTSYPVLITAEDNTGKSITEDFIILIRNTNEPPVLLNPIPDVTSFVDEEFYFQIPDSTFFKDEYSNYRYTANLAETNSLPSWLSFDQYSGVFASSNPVVGTYNIEVMISDWYYTSIPDSFKISIIKDVDSTNESPDLKPINIYPNPSSNYFYIKNIPHEITEYRIINIYGRVLFVQNKYSNNGDLRIDLSQYPNGLYFLQLIGNSVDEVYKLIKK